MAIAITVSISAALAFNTKQGCAAAPQYYKYAWWYLPAGTYGVDYSCIGASGLCTYYKPDPIGQPNYYAPCRFGMFNKIYH